MYLRWAGGKSLIAKDLIERFPKSSMSSYIEPFFGSGSMFFSLCENVIENNVFYEKPSNFTFSDTNKFLINCHIQVRDNLHKVYENVKNFEQKHNSTESHNVKDYYNSVRKSVTSEKDLKEDPILSAARFIYINKSCFNGLWRVNSKGKFNVPYNKRFKIHFDIRVLEKASTMLKSTNIYEREFDQIDSNELGNNSFVYMDPPYVPIDETSNFTAYTQNGFSVEKDLKRLVELCKRLDSTNTKWMMSNSYTPEVLNAFSKWNIGTIEVHRFVKAITTENETRKKVTEAVITNY